MSEGRARAATHIAILAVSVVAGIFALRPPDYLQYIVIFSGTGLAATFLFPTVLAVFWTGMNRTGCLAGIATGFIAFLAQYAAYGTRSFLGLDPFVWSLGASVLACVIGSKLGPRDPRAVLSKYFAAEEL